MAIRESGVKLTVQNLSGFLAGIEKANQSVNSFGAGAKSFSIGGGDPFAGFASSADRNLGTVKAKFGALNSFLAGVFAGAGAALANALISGVTTAAGAIPGLLKSAFSQAIDLQQSAADAFAIVQPSAQDQKALADLAEQVALSPNLQVSQAGALQAIDAALKANISSQQLINDGVLQAIVAQQNALGGTFEENARLIAKQLNDQAGQAQPLSAQQLVNQNVGTFQAGQFRSINDLLLAQAASGGALKSLGLSQQQFNEFLAVAGTTASGGSDAGTSVKAFINAATNASKEQASAQKALGFKIADDQGQFNSALQLSQQLSKAREEGINAIISSGGGTKEQQAELKRLNSAINSNLNSAKNLEAGITGANLSPEKRAQRIATANQQAQAAKKQFDEMLGTIPGLKQTATKIKASETEFAGLLFQAFGTDGGRLAAALSGLSEEEAARIEAIITGADALEVAGIKTNTVKAKLENIGDIFSANLTKIAQPSLKPLQTFLGSVAELGGKLTPIFEATGNSLARLVSGPLTQFASLIDQISVGVGEDGVRVNIGKLFNLDTTDQSFSISLGKLFSFDTSDFGGQLQLGSLILSWLNGQSKFNLSLGDYIDISGGISPDGVFTLSLNDSNFSVDLTAIQTFAASVPTKISEAVNTALANPGQLVFSGLLFAGGIYNAAQTALTNAFGENFTIDIPDIAANIKTKVEGYFTGFTIEVPDFVADIKTKITGYLTNLTPEKLIGDAFSAFADPNIGVGGLVNLIPGISGLTASLGTLAVINWGTITAGVGGLATAITGLAASPFVTGLLGISTIVASINILNSIDVSNFSTVGQTVSDAITGILDVGTNLVDGINAESLAGSIDGFVTGFVDRLSATISGVDTGAIATSALGFATSILNKLAGVFSDPNLGADIGASAGGLVGSLVNSLSNALSNPQAFSDFGSGAANLAISIGGFVTSLVGAFGTELAKVDFGSLVTNGVLDFASLAVGVGNAISDAFVNKIDEILGTKLASPQQRFEAFIDALIAAIDKLPVIGELVTTEAEKKAQESAQAAIKNQSVVGPQSIEASSLGQNNANYLQDLAQAAQQATSAIVEQGKVVSPQTIEAQSLAAQQSAEASKTWTESIYDAASAVANFAAGVAARTVVGGGSGGLGIISVPTVRLDAGNVQVDGAKVTTPNGEPQVTFTPQVGPIQGPQTREQAATPTTGGSSLLAGVGPIPVVIQNPAAVQSQQSTATPTGGGSGFLAPSLKASEDATGEIAKGASAFSAALKAAGSRVTANAAGTKIPPFKWPVVAPFNLGSLVQPFRWPDVQSVDLNSKIPAFPSWSTIIPVINIPSIPPFPGWGAFIGTVTPPSSGDSGSGGNSSAPSSGTGSGPRGGLGIRGQNQQSETDDITRREATGAIIKTMTDLFTGGGDTIKNYDFKIYSVSGASDLLKAILTGSNVEKQAAALEAGGNGLLSLGNPFTNGGSVSLNDRPIFPSGKSAAANKNDSPTVTALVQSPPQVVNNYYNTKNYNLSVYTLQSDASLVDQFSYMEHLAAGL